MSKKIIISILAFCFVFTSMGVVFAEGNKRKGKYTYRAIYADCYKRGAIEDKKPPVNPDAKTMAQWERIFDKKDFEDLKCSEEWNNLSEEDLQDIQAYLVSGAADSPTPAKCK